MATSVAGLAWAASDEAEGTLTPRSLAFYLPQYHPIRENDQWWGKGFTEWTNVSKTRPRFPGHYQPHLPADLGFYDLRLPEARASQAELAKAHSIDGFVYYHYWFNGRRLLERPFNDVLASGSPDLPFCLAWANENWTRAWDGRSSSPLLTQEYSTQDDLTHIRELLPAFADPRYVTYAGRPVFLVYRAGLLPEPKRSTDIWRAEVVAAGLPEPYLLRIESFPDERGDPAACGFDAGVEFAPRWWDLPASPAWVRAGKAMSRGRGPFRDQIHDYRKTAQRAMSRKAADYTLWPGVTPMWDNSARRASGALILTNSTPYEYGRWLDHAIRRSASIALQAGASDAGFVFINAWNEWAEGNHLEPDRRNGLTYLAEHRRVVKERSATLT